MNPDQGRPSRPLRSPCTPNDSQLAVSKRIDWAGNRPDVSNDPRAFWQEVPVIHVILHQAMGEIYEIDAIGTQCRAWFELNDILSGAGVAYLKHSLNIASI